MSEELLELRAIVASQRKELEELREFALAESSSNVADRDEKSRVIADERRQNEELRKQLNEMLSGKAMQEAESTSLASQVEELKVSLSQLATENAFLYNSMDDIQLKYQAQRTQDMEVQNELRNCIMQLEVALKAKPASSEENGSQKRALWLAELAKTQMTAKYKILSERSVNTSMKKQRYAENKENLSLASKFCMKVDYASILC